MDSLASSQPARTAINSIIVPRGFKEKRIDLAIAALFSFSRRKAKKILDYGGVHLNGKRIHIASRMVKQGDKLRVHCNEDLLTPVKPEINLKESDIVFEDEDFIIINKPPFVPVQATRDQSYLTCEKLVKKLLAARGTEKLVYLCHRLDKETSGCLVFAKSKSAMNFLTQQFKDRKVFKKYMAISHTPARGEQHLESIQAKGIQFEGDKKFTVNCRLSSIHPQKGLVKILERGGKIAVGKYEVIEEIGAAQKAKFSLVACFPQTGRSHQIRVQLAAAGLPIVGDKKYGSGISKLNSLSDNASHHLLHAKEIGFVSPQGKDILAIASEPSSFSVFLDKIRH